MTVDYKVLYDTIIDYCEIHYSNWAYLQCNKLGHFQSVAIFHWNC